MFQRALSSEKQFFLNPFFKVFLTYSNYFECIKKSSKNKVPVQDFSWNRDLYIRIPAATYSPTQLPVQYHRR